MKVLKEFRAKKKRGVWIIQQLQFFLGLFKYYKDVKCEGEFQYPMWDELVLGECMNVRWDIGFSSEQSANKWISDPLNQCWCDDMIAEKRKYHPAKMNDPNWVRAVNRE